MKILFTLKRLRLTILFPIIMMSLHSQAQDTEIARGKLLSSTLQKEVGNIILVTPYEFDESSDFENATKSFDLDGRAVCMPTDVYKKMRADQLSKRDIKEVCRRDSARSTFWNDFGAGFLVGVSITSFLIILK